LEVGGLGAPMPNQSSVWSAPGGDLVVEIDEGLA